MFRGVSGGKPTPSLNLSLWGQQYSLGAVSYHLALGLSLQRNHFVSQFRARGSSYKYDGMRRGVTTSCVRFDAAWNATSMHMVVYLKTSLCVEDAPRLHGSPPSSPDRLVLESTFSGDDSEPDSPCGRRRCDSDAFW